MLHRVNPPDAACQAIFARILEFERQVLGFACNSATTLPLAETAVMAEFEPSGEWFWRQLHVQRGPNKGAKNELHKALETAIQHVQANPDIGQRILDAFDHDIGFPDHLNDASFQFSYRTLLDNTTRAALKSLLVAFYEDLFYDGYPACVHGNAEKFDRNTFLRHFWSANHRLNVCPACDSQRPDSIDDRNYSDVDHYLPKAEYSFLAVHPANLVPICKDCNISCKGARAPVDNDDAAPLVNMFIPYHRSALDFATVNTDRPGAGPLRFSITDADGLPSLRIVNLNRTYCLEQRWPSRESQIRDSITGELRIARRRLGRFGAYPDSIRLEDELTDMLDSRTKGIGRNYNYVLHASYLRFAVTDRDEFEELFRQFVGE